MVGVIGKAIKGFGKALKSKPKGKFSTFPSEIVRTLKRGVVDRNVKSKEVFKTIQGLRKKPYKGAKENLDKIYKKKGIDYKKPYKGAKENLDKIYKQTLRHKTMKQMGLKGPKYTPSGKKTKTGAIKLEEVWKYNPYKKASSKRAGWGAHLKRRSRVL